MNKKKKVMWTILFTFINIFLIIGFIVIVEATRYNSLKSEVRKICDSSITSIDYNTYKSGGKFLLVEKAIKDYLKDYSDDYKSVMSIVSSDEFKSLLSVKTYDNDGPEFANSIIYIESNKKIFNEKIDNLINYNRKDLIKSYIYKYTNDSYCISLYNNLMFGDDIFNKLKTTKSNLSNTKLRVNRVFDGIISVYNFLKTNKSSWNISDNQIKFNTNELLNNYNLLIEKVK